LRGDELTFEVAQKLRVQDVIELLIGRTEEQCPFLGDGPERRRWSEAGGLAEAEFWAGAGAAETIRATKHRARKRTRRTAIAGFFFQKSRNRAT